MTNLATALAALQAELPRIEKSERANVVTQKGSYSYSYADLANISATIIPLLSKHGLAFIAKPCFDDGGRFVLAYSLLHTSGEREDGAYPLPTSGTPQAIGSAITYGRRYCLCAVTGVAPEEDDDDAAQAQQEQRRGTAQRAAAPARRQVDTTPAKRTAQRATPPPLPSDGPAQITAPQRAKLMASFGQLGIDDRTERLDIASRVAGRTLDSANDMTKAEAHKLIDLLDKAGQQDNPQLYLAELTTGSDADPAGDPPTDPAEA